MTDTLKAYYLLYAARYSQGMVSVFIEHKRKDFWEMLVHHFVTVSLIGISYVHGWNRVGAVVMILLDPQTCRCTLRNNSSTSATRMEAKYRNSCNLEPIYSLSYSCYSLP